MLNVEIRETLVAVDWWGFNLPGVDLAGVEVALPTCALPSVDQIEQLVGAHLERAPGSAAWLTADRPP